MARNFERFEFSNRIIDCPRGGGVECIAYLNVLVNFGLFECFSEFYVGRSENSPTFDRSLTHTL